MAKSGDTRVDHSQSHWASRSLRRWRWAAAVSTLALLGILAWAPMKELLQPWRRIQAEYNALATTYGLASRKVDVHQIWLPAAEKADRCGTCHLGAVGEPALENYPPFGPHPPIPHIPEVFGCTYCHAGQGWATVADDAHGILGTWPHPIFGLERIEAGCGTCHSGLVLPLPEDIEDAPDLVEGYGCLSCHSDPDRPAGSLDGIGLRGVPKGWVLDHRGLIPANDDTAALEAADDDELAILDAWLTTKVGAPHLARGKMVFHQLGCLGCHRRGEVGGDVGPDLTGVGDKDVRNIGGKDSDSRTLPQWLFEHLSKPQALDPTSRMPPIDTEELELETDLDDLTTYLLSLRKDDLPTPFTPPDRARVIYGLGRDFPTTGRGLYVTFCSACHGFRATGKELDTLDLLAPMIGSRGYLATVTPRYLRSSILRGRRGRYMPAWGPDDGGLGADEVERIVDYLMSRGFRVKSFEDARGSGDPDSGREVFDRRCVSCHVNDRSRQEPIRFGSDLLAPGALEHFSEETLYGAIMRGWVEEGMPSFAFLKSSDRRDLLAFLRPFLKPATGPTDTTSHDGRHSHLGTGVWGAKCLSCHGGYGEGSASGPMLNSGPYLQWATDEYLGARTRAHQRKVARATIGTLSDDDLDAVLDFIRTWSGYVEPAAPSPPQPDAVARGRELYSARCSECHGDDGRGKTGPALANRDFLDLAPRPFLIMTILEGRKGTAMQAWGERSDLPVGIQDAFDLADYILSLAEPGSTIDTASLSARNNSNQGG